MKRLAWLMPALALFLFTGQAAARTPYASYTYTNSGRVAAAPAAAFFDRTVDGAKLGIGTFSKPAGLYVAADGRIYIADTGNNRIVVLNGDYSLSRVLSGYQKGPAPQSFSAPQGMFVAKDGTTYVADTGNKRIVRLSADGSAAAALPTPKSPVLGSGFDYQPTRVFMDSAGRIFVISKGYTGGVVELDKNGNFAECIGAPKVIVSALTYFWKSISTKAQQEQTADFVPTEYNDIFVDSADYVFATTSSYDLASFRNGSAVPVRRLNAAGTNILRRTGSPPYGDLNTVSTGAYAGPPQIAGVTCLDNGMYAILDANHCRVFVYDADGRLLFEFGTPGTVAGSLQTPSDLAWTGGSMLVLDQGKNTVSVFSLTAYGAKLLEATRLHNQNDYAAEDKVWADILKRNGNNTLALQNLGLVAYHQNNYATAMQYFRTAQDTNDYSRAFTYYRRALINRYFDAGVVVLFVLIAALILLCRFRKRIFPHKVRPDSYLGHLGYGFRLFVAPLDGYWCLTREGGGSLAASLTIVGAAAVVSMLQARFTGFIFAGSTDSVNLPLELLKIIGPFFLFCVCNWCVTSLMSGESTFKGILTVTGYALLPLLLLLPFSILFSNIMTLEEGNIQAVFVGIAYALTLFFIVCGNKQVNDYDMGKALFVLFLTVVVMLIIVFLGVLLFALMQQMFGFVRDVFNEISLRYM